MVLRYKLQILYFYEIDFDNNYKLDVITLTPWYLVIENQVCGKKLCDMLKLLETSLLETGTIL